MALLGLLFTCARELQRLQAGPLEATQHYGLALLQCMVCCGHFQDLWL